jgi:hypothetical protein
MPTIGVLLQDIWHNKISITFAQKAYLGLLSSILLFLLPTCALASSISSFLCTWLPSVQRLLTHFFVSLEEYPVEIQR